MPPACGSCCGRRPPALAEKPGIRSARLVPIARRAHRRRARARGPGQDHPGPVRRYVARRRTSPGSTVSSPRRRGSASRSCETARAIAEIARNSRQCRSSVAAGRRTPTYVSAIASRLRTLALLGLIVVLTDVTWDRRIAPRLDGLAGTTTHRPSRRPPATPPAHRRETHRANAGRRVVSGTLRSPEHAGRARRHGTRIERSSPCVS